MNQLTKIIIFRGCGNSDTLSKCKVCTRKLVVGKNIVTKISSGNKRVHYHIKCAKQKNII